MDKSQWALQYTGTKPDYYEEVTLKNTSLCVGGGKAHRSNLTRRYPVVAPGVRVKVDFSMYSSYPWNVALVVGLRVGEMIKWSPELRPANNDPRSVELFAFTEDATECAVILAIETTRPAMSNVVRIEAVELTRLESQPEPPEPEEPLPESPELVTLKAIHAELRAALEELGPWVARLKHFADTADEVYDGWEKGQDWVAKYNEGVD